MTQIPTWSSANPTATNGRAAPGLLIGGRYTLRAAVGHGGMGTVWRAADKLLRRDVAVKEVVLPPGLAPSDRDAMYERTMREARAAAALQHPAVVQVYDVVHENGRPWIVMELLDARSLADMVIEDGPVAPRVVAKIGIALLGALEVAHAHGVLHRDVKPANVLICADGRCVLTDFGVARMPTDVQLTTPGMVLGSPHFISPERAMGSAFGPPSDLFSLGVTLYTAIEGRPPFDKGDPIETMHAVVEDPPLAPVRAGTLTVVLMGLLEKDPARRFDVATARTILRQQLAGPLASTAPPHLMTDPYSVVPIQRPAEATQPIPPPAAKPSGQIGGRAMLAPGESLTGRLAELRNGNHKPARTPSSTSAVGNPSTTSPADTSADLAATASGPGARAATTSEPDARAGTTSGPGARAATTAGTPAGAEKAPAQRAGAPTDAHNGATRAHRATTAGAHSADNGRSAWADRPGNSRSPDPGTPRHGAARPATGNQGPRHGTNAGGDTTSVIPPREAWNGARAAGTVVGGAAARRRARIERLVQTTRGTAEQLATTVRAWPRNTRLAAAGGLAAVLVLGFVVLLSGDGPSTPSAGGPGAAQLRPADFPTQAYADRGLTVNVPKSWVLRPVGKDYVDFVDPQVQNRKVRILVEPSRGTASSFLGVAEGGLKGGTANCPNPYTQVSMTPTTIAAREGGVLEYTCGTGDSARHGKWGAIVHDGNAYSFYLITDEARFAESRGVFDEMVRSFALQDA